MRLKDIFYKTTIDIPQDIENIEIDYISRDSRDIKINTLFIAYKGIELDSHKYILTAIENGSTVIIGTESPNKLNTLFGLDFKKIHLNLFEDNFNNIRKIYYIQVDDSRKILALVSANWFGRPADKLKIIGITGTDGKTTTCNMLYSIIKSAGYNVNILSTLNSPGLHVTTPDSFTLHKILKDFVEEGFEWIILESSSHGMAYNNVYGIIYEISGLTNITPEHMDFHNTFENYINAKAKLFLQSKISVLPNTEIGLKIQNLIYLFEKDPNFTFNDGQTDNKSFRNIDFIPTSHNIKFYNYFDAQENFFLNIPGEHNIKNASLALKIAQELNIDNNHIKTGLENLQILKGRWEIIYEKEFSVIVDFAHTANALHEVLTTAKEYMKNKNLSGRLIHIFGCAGERDKEKRYEMGKESAQNSNISILTSEDPRREQLSEINKPLIQAFQDSKMSLANFVTAEKDYDNLLHNYFIINWRGSAISFAINKLMRQGDTLIVTGKGHEESMSFETYEYAWTDQNCIQQNLNIKNNNS